MNAHTMDHTLGRGTTAQLAYDQAIERTCVALRDQDLCVLDAIDVRRLLKERFNPRFHPYLIVSACDRALVRRALQDDPMCVLMLCNVMVYSNGDGTSTVETLNPPASVGLVSDDPTMVILVQEAESSLRRAVDSLIRSEERRQRA